MRELDREQVLATNPRIDRVRLEEAERQLEALRNAGLPVPSPRYSLDPALGRDMVGLDQRHPLRCEAQSMPQEPK